MPQKLFRVGRVQENYYLYRERRKSINTMSPVATGTGAAGLRAAIRSSGGLSSDEKQDALAALRDFQQTAQASSE